MALAINASGSPQKSPVAPPWLVPESAKPVKNPVVPSPEGLKVAKRLYAQNCASCHGAHGVGNGPLAKNLAQRPMNFTNAKAMKTVSDGELYWKITHGRLPMPSWAEFSVMRRWQLVNYIRTFAR